jgi:hypothetical protein
MRFGDMGSGGGPWGGICAGTLKRFSRKWKPVGRRKAVNAASWNRRRCG